jgi:hypothetical protein
MFYHYTYERDIYPRLDQLPLNTRMKLDLTGVKISLRQWLAFNLVERQVLCHLPVRTVEERDVFSAYADFLCMSHTGVPAKRFPPLSAALWDDPDRVPDPVVERSRAHGQAISLDEWKHWHFHQRYGLYKTAISKNEPEKFAALLTELRDRQADSGQTNPADQQSS